MYVLGLIHKIFQGEIKIDSQIAVGRDTDSNNIYDPEGIVTSTRTPFMFLSLDLPASPLFLDEAEKNIIPQVSLASLLSKYDGINGKVSIIYIRCLIHSLLQRFSL
jgi:U4/U6.U5 tri-snRNP-associated protein 2